MDGQDGRIKIHIQSSMFTIVTYRRRQKPPCPSPVVLWNSFRFLPEPSRLTISSRKRYKFDDKESADCKYHMPVIKDTLKFICNGHMEHLLFQRRCFSHACDKRHAEILRVFKDLMASSWHELPDAVVHDAKRALSKNSDDKAGQEILKNIFGAAEAVEEFGSMSLWRWRSIIGLSGEDVKPLPLELSNALRTVYQRYST